MILTVGVLALQGGFAEHLNLLKKAANNLDNNFNKNFNLIEVRTPEQLSTCDGLVIPGGESTTLSLVAAQSGLLEPLREFVKIKRKPVWGTCAGLIMLSEEASSTKRGGQEVIGGLDVRVHRNHFGRQRESFITDLNLAFLAANGSASAKPSPFPAVFIRAPVVDKLLTEDVVDKSAQSDVNEAVSQLNGHSKTKKADVEVLGILPGRHASNQAAVVENGTPVPEKGDGDIVALRQGNVFGTSFHPELTDDIRIHVWWLNQVARDTPEKQ